jgi:hypothetical protein
MSDSAAPAIRYAIRPDHRGFSVFDVWTGQPVQLAMNLQTGLSKADAEHTARLFNQRLIHGLKNEPRAGSESEGV